MKHQDDLSALDLCTHPIQTMHATPYSNQYCIVNNTNTFIRKTLLSEVTRQITFNYKHSLEAQHVHEMTTSSL